MKAKTLRTLREIIVSLVAIAILVVTVLALGGPDQQPTLGCVQGVSLILLAGIGLIILIAPKPISHK